jgi:hypothetical protein
MTNTFSRKKYHRMYYRKNREFILRRAKIKALRMRYKSKFNLSLYVENKKKELIKNDKVIISFT